MRHSDGIHKLALAAFIVTSTLVIMAATAWGVRFLMLRNQISAQPQSADTALGGFPMPGNPAPDFKLIDQFGQPITLSSLRGREVVLAFIDSRCSSLCPLTAEIMYYARARLGASAARQVVLVAVNANPAATSVATVQAWSINHGMLHQWLFLTGTAEQLQSVYRLYNVYVQVDSSGQDVHDPATFIVDTSGRERLYFETLDSNSKPDLTSQELGLEAGMQQWLPQHSN
jgi:cytochrome oxidase Cu insertion factor (SCO1/SenC/PrrC family)